VDKHDGQYGAGRAPDRVRRQQMIARANYSIAEPGCPSARSGLRRTGAGVRDPHTQGGSCAALRGPMLW